jgi:hypothetical protein
MAQLDFFARDDPFGLPAEKERVLSWRERVKRQVFQS